MKKQKRLRPRRVLVVDDEPSFTRMVKRSLEGTGEYEVETVNEGAGARRAALDFNPDIVLLDLVMPQVDGGDVATAIRNDEMLKHIPIVFVSAMVSKGESGKGLYQSGGEYFIAKPVSTKDLTSAIEQLTHAE